MGGYLRCSLFEEGQYHLWIQEVVLDPNEPGEQRIEFSADQLQPAIEFANEEARRLIREGIVQIEFTQPEIINNIAESICEPASMNACKKSITTAAAVGVLLQAGTEFFKANVPNLISAQKKVWLKDSRKGKAAVEYYHTRYKGQYAKALSEIQLLITKNMDANGRSEYMDASFSSMPSARKIKLQKVSFNAPELKGLKKNAPSKILLDSGEAQTKNMNALQESLLMRLVGSKYILNISDELYHAAGEKFESRLVHEISHYIDFLFNPEVFNAVVDDFKYFENKAIEEELAKKEYEELKQTSGFKKYMEALESNLRKFVQAQHPGSDLRPTALQDLLSKVQANYERDFAFFYSYLNTRTEKNAFIEQMVFLKTKYGYTLEQFLALEHSNLIYIDENEKLINYRKVQLDQNSRISKLPRILPDFAYRFFKDAYGK